MKLVQMTDIENKSQQRDRDWFTVQFTVCLKQQWFDAVYMAKWIPQR